MDGAAAGATKIPPAATVTRGDTAYKSKEMAQRKRLQPLYIAGAPCVGGRDEAPKKEPKNAPDRHAESSLMEVLVWVSCVHVLMTCCAIIMRDRVMIDCSSKSSANTTFGEMMIDD